MGHWGLLLLVKVEYFLGFFWEVTQAKMYKFNISCTIQNRVGQPEVGEFFAIFCLYQTYFLEEVATLGGIWL